MLISFVIPCYRSAATIGTVVDTIQETVAAREGFEAEIILVNDCSPDRTFEVIRELTDRYSNVVGIDLARNSGQQCAIMAGLRYSRGELVAVSDDDGQTPIETVFTFYEKMVSENYDVVCARYGERGRRSLFRRLGSRLNDAMVKYCLDKPDDINTSVYFLAKRFVVDEMVKYDNAYPFMSGLLLRTTLNIGNVDLTQKDRLSGSSGYNLRKLLHLWINGLTTFSIKPLRSAAFFGGIMAAVGFIFLAVLIIRKLVGGNIALGWTSLMATNILIGGIILIVLGLIGEYIGRIYLCLNHTPQYVVRSIIDNTGISGEKRDA